MNPDLLIAAACLLGPALFAAIGYYCGRTASRQDHREVMKSRTPTAPDYARPAPHGESALGDAYWNYQPKV